MKLLNPNTPISNYIYTIINEKNKQIKENILLGDINFPKILFYSNKNEENIFENPSHKLFIKNLNRQKQLSEVREEKLNLEKKVNMVDNQLLNIRNLSLCPNKLNFSEKYLNTNLEIIKTINNKKVSRKNSKFKDKKGALSDEKKNKNISSLPTLGKERITHKKVQNIVLKPIKIKSYKSNSKVYNHENEERLEKNAKAFIQKLNKNKKDLLSIINKKQEKFSLKLKKEIDKLEIQKKLKLDEYNKNNILYNYKDYSNINNINNNSYLDNNLKREENKYSPENSRIKNYKTKKYYHYSPYNYHNPKMLKNLSKDLLNFNSELYYNNNIPDIIQYHYILAPLQRNNNIINKVESSPLINIEEIGNLRTNNFPEINDVSEIDRENGENISSGYNYSIRNDESNLEINMADNSFNKKHLYYFNEPKYEIELTSRENDDIINQK